MTTLKLDQFLPYRLSIVSNRVSSAVASTYQALFGLKIPEWRLVAIIAEGEGATQQALGVATRMDKVTVSRAAAALVERGLIERRPNANDQRSHMLTLTEAGRTLYENVAPKALELESQVFAGFTAAEIKAFRAMLDRIETSAAPFDADRA
ncbi:MULTISPECIES: MarR family winged helix-turn-helix transcriptional regulator [Sphingomonas]|uniref:MarR family winged helix-turn-helix transcriptional regulator n=1 Tax=Sphingomonas TaxID=13687 RepID=UPI0024130AF8|nr:MarR family transcriptional regulator [Sphingomonas echinoides]